jgi:hypothetical protein
MDRDGVSFDLRGINRDSRLLDTVPVVPARIWYTGTICC